MDYGSNLNMSNKARESKPNAEPEKKLSFGSVELVEHKPNFFEKIAHLFISEDVVDVKGYIVHDVLIPGVRDLVADIIHGTTDAVFYGDRTGRYHGKKKGPNSNFEYSSIFASNGFNKSERTSQRGDRVRPIIARSRAEAEDLLTTLAEYIDTTGSVSVGQVYGALEWDTNPNDFKWGWESLGAADVERVKEGYLIKLPRPHSLV